MSDVLHAYITPDALAVALSAQVAAQLRAAIRARGTALLAVSGGTTPIHFFQSLSQASLDWSKLIVTLVDERWVDEGHVRSNARLVKMHLLRDNAAAATFVSLYLDTTTPELALPTLRANLSELPQPFDVVVLGMGSDGHTASFFPHGDHLDAALDQQSTTQILALRAPGAEEPRITLTLPVLLNSRTRYLHIQGQNKLDIFRQAQQPESTLPIAKVIHTAPQLDVFWCP